MRFGKPFIFNEKTFFTSEWTPWYAWYPVRLISGEYVWLETVSRRYQEVWTGYSYGLRVYFYDNREVKK
jgi:hypothetical protein